MIAFSFEWPNSLRGGALVSLYPNEQSVPLTSFVRIGHA